MPNEFRQVLSEEGITAVYIRALKPDCFDHYHYRELPTAPAGYWEDYESYKMITSSADRSAAWKRINEKHRGYLRAKEDIELANLSNKKFLEEMQKHFEDLGMIPYSEKCRIALLSFVEGV